MDKRIDQLLLNEDMIIDDLGRLVITNKELLAEVRGAAKEFGIDHLSDDSSCANSNCESCNTNCTNCTC